MSDVKFLPVLKFSRLPHADGIQLPEYAHPSDAGMDIRSAADTTSISPGDWAIVPTGLCVSIPDGYEIQVRPRSGLAAKHGVTVLNSPGTIDAGYLGEIKVILINHGDKDFLISRGDRIAQLMVAKVAHATTIEVTSHDSTDRGEGGFGSTGVK